MNNHNGHRNPEWYAADFISQLHLDSGVEQKCERTCLLWSKEHWADEAKRVQVNLQLSRERTSKSADVAEGFTQNAKFLSTIAEVYGRLFGFPNQLCPLKKFEQCPYLDKRQDLLEKGSLASVFVTILHKATMYAMLDKHPLDSGLLNEKYDDVYGIDLTNLRDIEDSLKDGRFEKLYLAVLKRAKQLAGIPYIL